MSSEQTETDKTLGQAKWILVLGVAIIFVAPWLFTREWCLPSFTGTGAIGDTIGGVTAPFLNLIGADKFERIVINQFKTI